MTGQPSNRDSGQRPLPFKPPGGARLESWKEIAAYFQRDVRTVQRWEKTEGLPVHRHSHEKGGTIYAHTAELESWWNGRAAQAPVEEPAVRPRRRLAIGGGILAVLLIGAIPVIAWKFVLAGNGSRAVVGEPAASIPGRLFANGSGEGAGFRWIAVGHWPVAALVSPDDSRIYVSNSGSGTVSVVNGSDFRLMGSIDVGGQPGALAMAPDGRRLYVANIKGYVSDVDLASNTVRSIPAGGPVSDLSLTPDGRTVYLATGFHGLQQLSPADGRVTPMRTAAAPMYLAGLPNGSRLYINYQAGGPGGRPGHDAIDALDLLSGRFTSVMSGPPNVGGPVAASPDGSQVWVNGLDACQAPAYDHAGCPMTPGAVIHVLRPSDNQIIRTLGYPATGLGDITFFPDASRAVIGGGDTTLRVVDTTRFQTVEAIDLEDTQKITFTRDGRRAYCPVRGRDAVAVFEVAGKGCQPAPRGLLALWTGDGIAEDVLGMGGAASAADGPFAAGLVGQAFRLDGRARPMTLEAPQYGSGPTEMTVAAWIKPSAAAGTAETALFDVVGPADAARDDSPRGWRVVRNPVGHVRLCPIASPDQDGCGSGGAVGRAAIEPGVWTYVAVSRSANAISVSVHGEPDAEIPTGRMPNADNVKVRIGWAGRTTAPFRGLVDEVQWFSRALSSTELESIVNAGAAGLCYGQPATP